VEIIVIKLPEPYTHIYRAEVDMPDNDWSIIKTMRNWCEETIGVCDTEDFFTNSQGSRSWGFIGNTLYFNRESDVVLFKLAWT